MCRCGTFFGIALASGILSFWTVQPSSILYPMFCDLGITGLWQCTRLPLSINLCISNPWQSTCCFQLTLLWKCLAFSRAATSMLRIQVGSEILQSLLHVCMRVCMCVCECVHECVKKGVITNYFFSHALVYKPEIFHKSGACNKAYETVQSKV